MWLSPLPVPSHSVTTTRSMAGKRRSPLAVTARWWHYSGRSPWAPFWSQADVSCGRSPAKEKARDKARVKGAETFGAWAEKRLRCYQMADSTRYRRHSVYARELEAKFGNQKLSEITHEDLRALTNAIVECGALRRFMRVRLYSRCTAGRLSEAKRSRPRQSWWDRRALPVLSREIVPLHRRNSFSFIGK